MLLAKMADFASSLFEIQQATCTRCFRQSLWGCSHPSKKCLSACTPQAFLPPAPAAAAPYARPPHTPRQHGQTGAGPRTSTPPAAANHLSSPRLLRHSPAPTGESRRQFRPISAPTLLSKPLSASILPIFGSEITSAYYKT